MERGGQGAVCGAGRSFAGFVPDLAAALRGGVIPVPLRIGSGVRVKILAAMAQGAPVVSTAVGCDGMPVADGTDILIRNTPGEFAAAVQLAEDASLWRRLAAAGLSTVREHYSPEQVRRRRNAIYASVVQTAARS